MESKFAPGFQNQDTELEIRNLDIEGYFPDWLSGSLLRTGPALYELEHQNLNHWYDGLAMLYNFSFNMGKVDFSCKYLQSKSYKKARANGRLQIKEWATDPCRTIFEKLKSFVIAPSLTDNGNINILKYGEDFLATSETPMPIIFDKNTLATIGHYKYKDDLKGEIDPSHPQYDKEGNVYSYLLGYNLISAYNVYKLDPKTNTRTKIRKILTRSPAYMHSIAKTENYIILAEFPFVVNPMELKFGDKPLIENYKWKPHLGTVYQVVDLKSGSVKKYEGDPYFAFHHVNAFEENDLIHLDLIAFPDAEIVERLYLKDLRGNNPTKAAGKLHRITINKGNGQVDMQQLSEKPLELPSINYQDYNAKPYRYMYGAGNTVEGNWLDDITKIDTQTGEYQTWYKKHCYPSEPVFVKDPEGTKEDDGILLSVVLDSDVRNTFLLALNAKNLEEIGRATVHQVLPFSFHGNYFSD